MNCTTQRYSQLHASNWITQLLSRFVCIHAFSRYKELTENIIQGVFNVSCRKHDDYTLLKRRGCNSYSRRDFLCLYKIIYLHCMYILNNCMYNYIARKTMQKFLEKQYKFLLILARIFTPRIHFSLHFKLIHGTAL